MILVSMILVSMILVSMILVSMMLGEGTFFLVPYFVLIPNVLPLSLATPQPLPINDSVNVDLSRLKS
jgi:hypothetical protein